LFGVFDGHGGGEVARYTKKHFEELLLDVEEYKQSDFKEGLRKGFLKVDESLNSGGLEEVAKMKQDNPPSKSPLMKILTEVSKKKSAAGAAAADGGESAAAVETAEDGDDLALDSIGCTANVVMVDYTAHKLYVANAGDSRCIMGRAGNVVPLSFDHKPECEVEIARIEAAGSRVTEGRVDGHLNLTRALGDLKFKKKEELKAEEHPITANPDVFEYAFDEESDFILMGCDGVWETKSNE
jgi:serine/threonine protein phosphatase PrpC